MAVSDPVAVSPAYSAGFSIRRPPRGRHKAVTDVLTMADWIPCLTSQANQTHRASFETRLVSTSVACIIRAQCLSRSTGTRAKAYNTVATLGGLRPVQARFPAAQDREKSEAHHHHGPRAVKNHMRYWHEAAVCPPRPALYCTRACILAGESVPYPCCPLATSSPTPSRLSTSMKLPFRGKRPPSHDRPPLLSVLFGP